MTVTVAESASPAPPPDDVYEGKEPAAEATATKRFEGSYFSVDHPADWNVETAEASKGSYLDTTIRDASRNPATR